MTPEICLTASAREWSDRLHRFVLDHGGAIVRGRAMSAEQAVASAADVVFVDDICSFLSASLVVEIRAAGRAVVGVFDPADGTDAKRRLLEVGISDVIESEASAEEFLALARGTLAHLPDRELTIDALPAEGLRIGITGPAGGVGVTEIACAVSVELSARHPTVLIDFNQSWPGVGQRMDLPVHPNLRTTVDLALHDPGRVPSSMHHIDRLDVVAGLANPGAGSVSEHELATVVAALSKSHDRLVVDLGPMADEDSALFLRSIDVLLLIGLGNPSGVTRLIRAYERVLPSLPPGADLAIVVNRVASSPRQRDEIRALLAESAGATPVLFIPEDPQLSRRTWDGIVPARGRFARSTRQLARLFDGYGDAD